MAWKARKPRSIARASDALDPTIAGRQLVPTLDPRQPDLFTRRGYIPPMLATLASKVPTGPRWQYEVKHDGYRIQAHVGAGAVRLYTRGGFDWAERMPGIVAALSLLPATSAILDGEAVQEGQDGVSDFFALHAALADRFAPTAFLVAFDLLELDGRNLRSLPLAERRAMLAETLAGCISGVELSEHMTADGEAMLRAACGMGLPGSVRHGSRAGPLSSSPGPTGRPCSGRWPPCAPRGR